MLREDFLVTKKKTLVRQLSDAVKLAVDATQGITDIVESMHHRIGAGPSLLGKPLQGVVKAVSAPTYAAIRGITKLVGMSIETFLAQLEQLLPKNGIERGTMIAAINGVLGDYLAESKSSLAMEMRLCSNGLDLSINKDYLQQTFTTGNCLLILLHGSSLDEGCWQRKGYNYGSTLAQACDLVPIYLRYNSGLHISENGQLFALLLEDLVRQWPRPVENIILLGHSMGGLVARSACHYAEGMNAAWRSQLSKLITLGAPHHGSPLERGGNSFETILGLHAYSKPLEKLGRIRSAGVTDLRFGNVLDEHWQGRDRFARSHDPRTTLNLPAKVECYAVAASIANKKTKGRQPGDGLVPIRSALGLHEAAELSLDFPLDHQLVVYRTAHLDLLSNPQVYQHLAQWCGAGRQKN